MDELTKIDDAVAEHVMRWQRRVYYWDRPKGEGNHYMLWCKNWQPTRNIAQAWQLVTKFESENYDVLLGTFGTRWRCIFESEERGYTGYGETAMMAIATCALKAAGVEIGKE